MKIIGGALVREQNENDVDDSCFDTSELAHMLDKIYLKCGIGLSLLPDKARLDLGQFIDENHRLQRHPNTKFRDDISSDQMHMYVLATKEKTQSLATHPGWPKTSNGDLVSFGLMAELVNNSVLRNLSLLFQIILFWIPVRWCDGENPTFRFGPIRLNIGYAHWCGDYRLFKQSLFYAPLWIRRLISKKTLKKMTREYWKPEPEIQWLIEIDDRFIEECL